MDQQLKEDLRRKMYPRYETIDGHLLTRAAEAGLVWLRTNQKIVNALNVFPVPDGDTGTNMVLTMQAAWDEVESVGDRSVADVIHAIAHGALMGARGNSGVILSQLWRGLARSLDGRLEVGVPDLARALAEARDTAYKGVVKPVEGTILTVAKDVATAAEQAEAEGVTSILELLERVVEAAGQSVERTPDLLPILKEAGVVDSGGKGLFFILEGMLRSAYGQRLDEPLVSVQPLSALNLDGAMEAIEPGQDWEVVVDFRPGTGFEVQTFYDRLESMGTSIQVGEGEGMLRMHIHVPDNTQYEPIEYIRGIGTITKVHLENLMDQTAEKPAADGGFGAHLEAVEPGQIAVVVVAPGPGIGRVFASLGAAAIIQGGQTMNPSTKEILSAFENLPTDKVVILPNNKNVRMAAEQTVDLTVKQTAVIPSVNVPQGVAAMFALDPSGDFESVVEAMGSALAEVHAAEITIATRSVDIDGVACSQGQVIALVDGRLIAAGDTVEEAIRSILEFLPMETAELLTLYFGEDLHPQEANRLADFIRESQPELEVELIDGGQPHYLLILSIE